MNWDEYYAFFDPAYQINCKTCGIYVPLTDTVDDAVDCYSCRSGKEVKNDERPHVR